MDPAARRPPVVVTPAAEVDEDPHVARPGVIVWLAATTPDEDEVARAAAMRRHPAGGESRHLRAVV